MLVRDLVRVRPGGPAVPNGTNVTVRKHTDDGSLGTVETTNGWYTFEMDGSPGAFYSEASFTLNGITHVRRQSSKSVGSAGPIVLPRLPRYFQLWSDGVSDAVAGKLAVSADGAGMSVTLADGGAVVKGILYDQLVARTVTISAAHATLPRLDRLVIEVSRLGSGEDIEGRSERKVLVGNPAGTPTAPIPSQSATVWQIPLATVRVDAGATAITSDKVTDERTYATPTLNTEAIRDTTAAFLKPGLGIDLAHNDAANTLTVAATQTVFVKAVCFDNTVDTTATTGAANVYEANITLPAGSWACSLIVWAHVRSNTTALEGTPKLGARIGTQLTEGFADMFTGKADSYGTTSHEYSGTLSGTILCAITLRGEVSGIKTAFNGTMLLMATRVS